jgi:hypothetical protein
VPLMLLQLAVKKRNAVSRFLLPLDSNQLLIFQSYLYQSPLSVQTCTYQSCLNLHSLRYNHAQEFRICSPLDLFRISSVIHSIITVIVTNDFKLSSHFIYLQILFHTTPSTSAASPSSYPYNFSALESLHQAYIGRPN